MNELVNIEWSVKCTSNLLNITNELGNWPDREQAKKLENYQNNELKAIFLTVYIVEEWMNFVSM